MIYGQITFASELLLERKTPKMFWDRSVQMIELSMHMQDLVNKESISWLKSGSWPRVAMANR